MTEHNKIKVIRVSDFSSVPGARYRKDGDGSAQEFFEDYVKPAVGDSISEKILIDFDRTWGYASSFISELARQMALAYNKADVRENLELKSDDEPTLIKRFWTEFAKDYSQHA
jgi:hypothetical protein